MRVDDDARGGALFLNLLQTRSFGFDLALDFGVLDEGVRRIQSAGHLGKSSDVFLEVELFATIGLGRQKRGSKGKTELVPLLSTEASNQHERQCVR